MCIYCVSWRVGFAPFFHGVMPTVTRDAIFGGMFAGIKYAIGKEFGDEPQSALRSLGVSMFSGSVACIVSAPWNYARWVILSSSIFSSLLFSSLLSSSCSFTKNPTVLHTCSNMQYATKPGEEAPTTSQSVVRLFRNASRKPKPLGYLQSRLRIGWVSNEFQRALIWYDAFIFLKGTARVAIGMAVGFEIYSRTVNIL